MSFCGDGSILKSIEPDFQKGSFRRIFVCKNGMNSPKKQSSKRKGVDEEDYGSWKLLESKY